MEETYIFSGNPLDRVSERRRDSEWVAGLLADPSSRILPLHELKPVIHDGSGPELDWQSVAQWRDAIASGATLILLGLVDGRAHFAIDASGTSIAESNLMDARALAPQIPQGEAAILAQARALIDWHDRHGFCAKCGNPTKVESAGWMRSCPACKTSHWPRTDPCVIMLTVRGDYGLLGRNRRRPGGRFSCLAGFVEPGETLEEAVRREVLEESGIRCGRTRYLASQPWPFPSNLMLGFLAQALSEEITVDPEELAEARWFHRDEIRTMVARAAVGPDDPSQLSLPPPLAIAHQILRRWSSGQDNI